MSVVTHNTDSSSAKRIGGSRWTSVNIDMLALGVRTMPNNDRAYMSHCAPQLYKGPVSEGNVAYPSVGKGKPTGRATDAESLPSAPPLPKVSGPFSAWYLLTPDSPPEPVSTDLNQLTVSCRH